MNSMNARARRVAMTVILTIALAVGGSAVAQALVGESGYQTCTSSAPNSWARAYWNGLGQLKSPGKLDWYYYNNAEVWTVNSRQGISGGGSWSAQTNRFINDSGTYAYCTNYS